ncbi:MAG: universal stress protein [Actinomycetota bacterium]|nr:universal stress protein [Actinomycetota bacterium]
MLEVQVQKIEAAGGTVAQAHLGSSERADTEIIFVAERIGAGLVVMGSQGRGGVRRALMGSVSDSGCRHAPCPVLVVRERGEKRSKSSAFVTRDTAGSVSG